MTNKEFLYKELSYQIIGACFTVHKRLGCGLPENVYNRALYKELRSMDIPCTIQQSFDVSYDGELLGRFITDLVVDDRIILELKCDERFTLHHEAQLMTYLATSGLRVGYLLNFGLRSFAFRRLIR